MAYMRERDLVQPSVYAFKNFGKQRLLDMGKLTYDINPNDAHRIFRQIICNASVVTWLISKINLETFVSTYRIVHSSGVIY